MNSPIKISHDLESQSSPRVMSALALVGLGALLYLFWDGVVVTWSSWGREEYSHGPLIPIVAVFLFFQRAPGLESLPVSGRWLGGVLVALGLIGWVMGELSSIYTVLQYAFLLVLYGLVVAVLGWPRTKYVWGALTYLLFMIPLPNFLYFNLSQQMQLLSSGLGVAVIRWFDISVFLEGNVIDLGVYKLQVVEACSGLNYLFPLMSFGFLLAYLFQGPAWQRCFVFVSTAPITILMNSLRIGIIGVLVEHFGIGMADGFLHAFEGWLIFIACVVLLLLEIKLFTRFLNGGQGLVDAMDLDWPDFDRVRASGIGMIHGQNSLIVCVLLLLVFVPVSSAFKGRTEPHLPRNTFASFPLFYKNWIGRQGSIPSSTLRSLKLTDHIVVDYSAPLSSSFPVNLYVAFYASQRKGASIHSPRSCMPGGGWEIQNVSQVELSTTSAPPALIVNRVVIQKGDARQLVYYWFQQRGRVITNEYLAKWYIFWDSLIKNRTDGALVRITVPVPEVGGVKQADDQLQDFIADFYPLVNQYIPD